MERAEDGPVATLPSPQKKAAAKSSKAVRTTGPTAAKDEGRSGWFSARDLFVVLGCGAVVAMGAVVKPFVSAAPGAAATASAVTIRRVPLELPSGAAIPSASAEVSANEAPLSGCAIPDKGMGPYAEVPSSSPFLAKVYVPKDRIGDSTTYRLLLHLHGGEPVRKLLALEDFDYVLATIDRGNGSSAYNGTFKDKKAWDELLAGIDAHVARALGHDAKATDITVSSWSAGYKGVDELLHVASADPAFRGLVLLDSLHASHPIGRGQLDAFVAAAKRASTTKEFFFSIAHSAIVPEGYASTTETAHYVLDHIGLRSEDVTDSGQDRLPLRSIAQKGRFEVRGYAGNDKAAHCDQLRLLPIILHREDKASHK